jgi:hypothetical protein
LADDLTLQWVNSGFFFCLAMRGTMRQSATKGKEKRKQTVSGKRFQWISNAPAAIPAAVQGSALSVGLNCVSHP